MGRPRTPTDILKMRGTYRGDRHARRTVRAEGSPRKPRWIADDPESSKTWDLIVGAVPKGVLAKVDGLMLAGAVRWFVVWRGMDERLKATPEYNVVNTCVAAWKQFASAASKLGLSPVDRERLTEATDSQEDNKIPTWRGSA